MSFSLGKAIPKQRQTKQWAFHQQHSQQLQGGRRINPSTLKQNLGSISDHPLQMFLAGKSVPTFSFFHKQEMLNVFMCQVFLHILSLIFTSTCRIVIIFQIWYLRGLVTCLKLHNQYISRIKISASFCSTPWLFLPCCSQPLYYVSTSVIRAHRQHIHHSVTFCFYPPVTLTIYVFKILHHIYLRPSKPI